MHAVSCASKNGHRETHNRVVVGVEVEVGIGVEVEVGVPGVEETGEREEGNFPLKIGLKSVSIISISKEESTYSSSLLPMFPNNF